MVLIQDTHPSTDSAHLVNAAVSLPRCFSATKATIHPSSRTRNLEKRHIYHRHRALDTSRPYHPPSTRNTQPSPLYPDHTGHLAFHISSQYDGIRVTCYSAIPGLRCIRFTAQTYKSNSGRRTVQGISRFQPYLVRRTQRAHLQTWKEQFDHWG